MQFHLLDFISFALTYNYRSDKAKKPRLVITNKPLDQAYIEEENKS